MITAQDMERLGLSKLLDYMDLTKEELHTFMVEERMYTIELLAAYLSEDSQVCSYCCNNYGHMEMGGICDDCLNYIESHEDWR